MKYDDYQPVYVRDNNYKIIGEVIESIRNNSYNALIFSIYDQTLASAALHQVVTLGDISGYGYINFDDKYELHLLKQLSIHGIKIGAMSGISRFLMVDECQDIQTWRFLTRNLHRNLYKELGIAQFDNLYCYECQDKVVLHGDCGAITIITIKQTPIILGMQAGKVVNPRLSQYSWLTLGYFQDINSFFKAMKLKNPFTKVSLQSLLNLPAQPVQHHGQQPQHPVLRANPVQRITDGDQYVHSEIDPDPEFMQSIEPYDLVASSNNNNNNNNNKQHGDSMINTIFITVLGMISSCVFYDKYI